VPRILHILPHPGGGAETYIDVLESLDDYEHRRVPLSSRREPLRALPSIAARRRSVAGAARNADLVHIHGDTSAILAPHPRETPMVWTTHGLHLLRRTTGSPKRLVLRGIGGAVRRSSVTICSSRREHDELAALLDRAAARDRLRTIVAGVPECEGRETSDGVRDELGIGSDTTVALFAAELEPRKAPLVAVNSTLEARRAGADLVLLVAGDGSLLPDVTSAAGDGIRVLGFRRDLDRLMAAADVFVLPSTREGLSLALLEAMSRSLVPVVAAGAGNPEAVGDAGIVVAPGDVHALATALSGLAGDPEERARLGAAARERQVSEFGVDRFLREVAGVYERALAERR
jgi:glycosyltransferase involved in cell wall biosynthesis